jgi:hypothetical protein
MESVLAVDELDRLIAELDSRMTEVAPEGRAPDSAICSLVGCDMSHWRC